MRNNSSAALPGKSLVVLDQAFSFLFAWPWSLTICFRLSRQSSRFVHGSYCLEQLSYYYLADELEGTYRGMMIALPPEDWQDLEPMSLTQLTSLLQDWARLVKLSAFTSANRKPKKKRPKPTYDPRHPHVSTARLLAEDKKSRAEPNK